MTLFLENRLLGCNPALDVRLVSETDSAFGRRGIMNGWLDNRRNAVLAMFLSREREIVWEYFENSLKSKCFSNKKLTFAVNIQITTLWLT